MPVTGWLPGVETTLTGMPVYVNENTTMGWTPKGGDDAGRYGASQSFGDVGFPYNVAASNCAWTHALYQGFTGGLALTWTGTCPAITSGTASGTEGFAGPGLVGYAFEYDPPFVFVPAFDYWYWYVGASSAPVYSDYWTLTERQNAAFGFGVLNVPPEDGIEWQVYPGTVVDAPIITSITINVETFVEESFQTESVNVYLMPAGGVPAGTWLDHNQYGAGPGTIGGTLIGTLSAGNGHQISYTISDAAAIAALQDVGTVDLQLRFVPTRLLDTAGPGVVTPDSANSYFQQWAGPYIKATMDWTVATPPYRIYSPGDGVGGSSGGPEFGWGTPIAPSTGGISSPGHAWDNGLVTPVGASAPSFGGQWETEDGDVAYLDFRATNFDAARCDFYFPTVASPSEAWFQGLQIIIQSASMATFDDQYFELYVFHEYGGYFAHWYGVTPFNGVYSTVTYDQTNAGFLNASQMNYWYASYPDKMRILIVEQGGSYTDVATDSLRISYVGVTSTG